jgi:hypothetical protein
MCCERCYEMSCHVILIIVYTVTALMWLDARKSSCMLPWQQLMGILNKYKYKYKLAVG